MSKSAFVSNSLGVAVAASEQLIPRLAVEYIWQERCKRYEKNQSDRWEWGMLKSYIIVPGLYSSL